jgi:uncharacterized BrkB/YihY/UPF0761 family membrane protein
MTDSVAPKAPEGTGNQGDQALESPGRVERWRHRAEQASDRYQQRAEARPLLGLPLAFIAQYASRQGILLASAVAFRLFLWLLPLALLAAGILSALAPDSGHSIESASKSAGITGAASQQVVTALKDGNRSWVIAVVTGLLLFLWATRTLMRNLTVVNAHAWRAPIPKRRQKDVLINVLLFAGAWILVLGFTAGLHRLVKLVSGGVILGFVLEGLFVSTVWLLFSRRLPDRRGSWVDLIPGSLLLGFGLSALSVVGRLYLPARFAHSSALYGSLGVASVMLLWMLLIGQLIVSSALTNSVWCDYRAGRPQNDEQLANNDLLS